MKDNVKGKPFSLGVRFFLGVSLAALLFFSCASQINGVISADGSASLSLNAALQPRATAMIRAFTSAAGQSDGLIIDGAGVAQSLRNAPGVASIFLNNTSPSAVEGTTQISDINAFLASAGGNKFITFDQTMKRCQINFNRENCSALLAVLSPEITNYLNALMAPAATGEEMSRSEYLELIAMFYNRAISEEIAGSQFVVSVELPGTVTEVYGGTFSGRQANIHIPLTDILVLETPLTYQVRWD